VNVTELQQALRTIGWPVSVDGQAGPQTKSAVWDFQSGFAFRPLAIDGQAGPQTQEALRECLDKGGKCSAYFQFREFKSKGNGWIKIARHHAFRLDRYREQVGPVSVISGYRDPKRNRDVGGATNSQHLHGTACDIPGVRSLDEVRAMRLFTGIGWQGSTGRVLHVDSRPGDPANPTTWRYG